MCSCVGVEENGGEGWWEAKLVREGGEGRGSNYANRLGSVLITTLTGFDQSTSFVLDSVLFFFFFLPNTEQGFCLISFFPCKSNLEENFST